MSLIKEILLQKTPYELDAQSKKDIFLDDLKQSMLKHFDCSNEFKNLVKNNNFEIEVNDISELPFLPARLFKMIDLKSINDKEIFKTMTSSGTTGQAVSKIFLDKDSAAMQTRVLSKIVGSYLGKKRRNMMIIDDESIIRDKKKFNARAAGILGFSSFGKNHTYLLDDNLDLDLAVLKKSIEQNGDQPLLIFGFTFLVWQKFYQQLNKLKEKIDFPENSVLIHGGGWKRLHDERVDNMQFKRCLNDLGILNVYDYYGMIEQTGSIFVECEEGFLHCSDFSDVLARDEMNLTPLEFNKQGILQVFSLLPSSYPGNSILTEDVGTIVGEDDCKCGRRGKYFLVNGRLELSEVRGCSDTRNI